VSPRLLSSIGSGCDSPVVSSYFVAKCQSVGTLMPLSSLVSRVLLSVRGRSVQRAAKRSQMRAFAPHMELLEDRTVPSTIAYQVPAGTVGQQAFGGPLGMDFDVQQTIAITRLGVFDSGSDGLSLPLTARIFNRDTQTQLAALSFPAGTPGQLVDGSRFLS